MCLVVETVALASRSGSTLYGSLVSDALALQEMHSGFCFQLSGAFGARPADPVAGVLHRPAAGCAVGFSSRLSAAATLHITCQAPHAILHLVQDI